MAKQRYQDVKDRKSIRLSCLQAAVLLTLGLPPLVLLGCVVPLHMFLANLLRIYIYGGACLRLHLMDHMAETLEREERDGGQVVMRDLQPDTYTLHELCRAVLMSTSGVFSDLGCGEQDLDAIEVFCGVQSIVRGFSVILSS